MATWPSGKAKVCKTFIHQFKSGRHLHMKEPTQYELFIETVYCVGFLYIRKALLQCASRIFLSYPDMRHEKVKLRKCRNKTLKNHDMNGYVSFEKWASSNWQGVRFFKSLCGRFSL